MAETAIDWHHRYSTGDTPWDSGEPSRELERILREAWVKPCRALELGCGTGTNAVFLAQQGFEVTALDIVPAALERARELVRKTNVSVQVLEADVLNLPDLGPPFPFVFDRGLYHVLRCTHLDAFRQMLSAVTAADGLYLTLAGNANETDPPEGGPPRVHAHEICQELSPLFDLVQLREFRFDGVRIEGRDIRPLGWSALLRREAS